MKRLHQTISQKEIIFSHHFEHNEKSTYRLQKCFLSLRIQLNIVVAMVATLFFTLGNAQNTIPDKIAYQPFADNANHWYMIGDKDKIITALDGRPRYKPTDIVQVADNILLYQKTNGGWPKNYDMFAILNDDQKKELSKHKHETNTTFDNGTGYTQVRALAIAYANTKDEKYKDAAVRGLKYILAAQYDNGGWPQYYPLQNNYSRHITYNDGGMGGIVIALKDIFDNDPLYDFIDAGLRSKLVKAYQKGIDCILKTQIKDEGVLTAWCQQHNEETLEPAWARKFEPPSICNGESADIVLLLMRVDHPDQKIINAIQSAIKWFQDSKIYNTKVVTIDADTMVTPYLVTTKDKVVVKDTSAAPIWTRYYELKTHRPLFCNRDSKVVYSLAEVARERRDGYAWYTYAPQKVLDTYPKWQKKWATNNNVLNK